MDGLRFDAWTRRRFGLAAAGLVAAMLGFAGSGDADARKRKNRRKNKKGCRKDAQCTQPNNPCQTGVCKKRKCRTKNQPNGASCGGDATCCDVVCTDTDTDFANCGGCDDACSFATADACVAGACVCGAEPECSGGEVCVGGQCGT